jgi:carboxyl-terminal processing protease
LAIGFDGLERAIVVGTEMRKLLGAVYTFPFKNFSFKYTMPAEKLFHVNNMPREHFIPQVYVDQKNIKSDEFMIQAMQMLSKNEGF